MIRNDKVLSIRKKIKAWKFEEKIKEPIEVVDSRLSGFFMIENIFIREFGALAGPMVGVLYMSLCMHSNKDRMCWPSIDLIAKEWGMSPRNVIRGLKWLGEHGIIKIHQERGKSNVYELLDKKKWRKVAWNAVRPATMKEMEATVNG